VSGTRHTVPPDVVVILGSQGAVGVARRLLRTLPEGFPAAVVYVQHRVASAGARLAELMSFDSALPVQEPRDGEVPLPGVVYVPAPSAETTFDALRRFAIREGRCRGNPLLVSAAEAFGPRCLTLILSGRLNDGAAGVRSVKLAGGRVLVQSPDSAEANGMPLAAMATGCYDFVLDPPTLGAALVALVSVRGAADLLAVRAHPAAVAGAL
jgi:two-component system chemotaxis response regulator CheB